MRRDPRNYRSKITPGAIKIDLPNTFQLSDYTCGTSALLAICAHYGVGPEEEEDVENDMGIDTDGSDPVHIIRAVKKYKLEYREYRGMDRAQLVECLEQKRPVMIMVQAWRGLMKPPPHHYGKTWDDGHWIIAIGYDDEGVYFEDPSINSSRGFLEYADLDDRWHDVEGADEHCVHRYGIAIWRPAGPTNLAFGRAVRWIG